MLFRSALSTETSTRTSADTSLSSALSTETSSRTSGDTSLSTAISNESSSRTSGDTSLSTALSTETSSRISGDISLSTTLSTETSTRTSADSSLSSALLTETSTRTSADSSLTSALSIETSNRVSGDSSLSVAISTINNSFDTTLSVNDLSVNGDTTILGNLNVVGQATSVVFNTLNVDISDNIIGLNAGADNLSENFRDTGIIYERGLQQTNVFAGFKENDDIFAIHYTTENPDFSGNDVTVSSYVDLRVNDLYFNDGSCNSLTINGTNISVALSSETSSRTSADTSLSTAISIETSSRTASLLTESSSRTSGDTKIGRAHV